MRKLVILLAAAFLLTAQAPAPADPVSQASASLNQGRYLEAVDALAAAAFDKHGAVRDRQAFYSWLQYSPFITNRIDPAVLDRADPSAPDLDDAERKRLTAIRPRDALEAIVERARETSIVILNEAHDSPRDRAFALEVARALRPLGYSVLAAETFINVRDGDSAPPSAGVGALAKDGFVRRDTGFYTADPVYADFVRQALGLGYRPVAYEMTGAQRSPGDGIEEREQAQANNLMTSIFASAPATKVLIFVGYSHAAELALPNGDGTSNEWMAARLKRLTGIDPLTIDQTTISETASARAARQAHALLSREASDRSLALFQDGRPHVLGQPTGAIDLQVIHPATRLVHGRPVWLARIGRKPVDIPRALLPATGRRLVQAFAADAPPDAVPLDQVVVRAGAPVLKLMLPDLPVRYATQP